MFQILYGSTAAGLYDQAAKLNAQARTLYLQSSDTYYKANDGASADRAEPNRTFCFACMMRRAGRGLCMRRLHARLQRYARAADSALPSPAVPPSPCRHVRCWSLSKSRVPFQEPRGLCAAWLYCVFAAAAAYDDWVRARAHWDYFYHRS